MSIRVFWLDPTALERVSLRRCSADGHGPCSAHPSSNPAYSYHRASVAIGDEPDVGLPGGDAHPHDDARWPTHCPCGYIFVADDNFYLDRENLYRRSDNAELTTLRAAPAGAMWDASWYRSHGGGEPWTGPDGLSLVVRLPNGSDWCPDQQASNCTRDQYGPKEIDGRLWDKCWLGRTHYCWVRHGDPRTGNVHVDKSGDTCAAGAGSILSGSYHGFLHDSHLVSC